MAQSPFEGERGDRRGMLIASLCFVHCVAGPLILSFAGFSSLIGASEKLEPVFLLSSMVVGTATLIPAYRKKHHRLSCLILFLCGVLCLFAKRYIHWTSFAEIIAVGVGATCIVGAHALNLKYSRRCECCESAADARCERGNAITSR